MKLPHANGFPLPAALLMLLVCGARVSASLQEDGAVVQESGDRPTDLR